MKAYLAIKFHEDFRNRDLIEEISSALVTAGIETRVMVRDIEKWGEVQLSPTELMKLTFQEISKADLVFVEFSEKGVGLGIEAGYAYAQRKRIIVIAKEGSEISVTLQGVADKVIFYNKAEELIEKIKLL